MKKAILVGLLLCSTVFSLLAQDVIIKRSGEEIKAKVKAVSDTEIEYIKFDNLDGPSYKIEKAEVLLIMYSNGTKDIFSQPTTPRATSTTPEKKGLTTPSTTPRPAQRYYNYDFFDKKVPLVYLGIDFSYCKLVGRDFEAPKTLFTEINTLLVEEKGKYDMNGAVKRSSLPYSYTVVDKRNAAIVESSVTENTTSLISYGDLQNIVDEYDAADIGVTDGLALVLICDNLNKPRQDAAFYYVVFDVASKKIVISDRLIGRAGGNGQRNYWARSVYETITNLRDRRYVQWKLMFRR